MYNIVIFSGGSGSILIQEGLSAVYENNSYNLDIIINAYYNGKSTGVCRKIFDSKILGPSDLRKNQLAQFRMQYSDELKNSEGRETALFDLLNCRFSAGSKEEYYNEAYRLLEESNEKVGEKGTQYLKSLIDYFFFEDIKNHVWRKTLEGVEFQDFAIANIFYSAAASMNGNSMRLSGKAMARLLRIKDNVHLISDVNLYLQAKTESGYVISDEGDIVSWDNPDDKIVSAILLRDGKEYIPTIDEETDLSEVRSIKDIVKDADMIIFSSGTQWSSLIPSYMHSGLRKILASSKAKKYLVMNNIEDHDMKGVTADEIIDILGRYIPMKDVTAIVNKDAVPGMNCVNCGCSISGHIGGDEGKHDPEKLVRLLMTDFLDLPDEEKSYVFDLDETLWDERANNYGKKIGIENMNLFNGIIHSGNTYEHVRDVFKYLYHQDHITEIYSDFGAVHFTSADYTTDLLTDIYVIDPLVAEELEKIKDFKGKVQIRGEGCVITIKPLYNREACLKKVERCLDSFGGVYKAYISGHTSIDIMHKDYNKKTMLKIIMEKHGLEPSQVVFVGNETRSGAESHISELGVRTMQMNDIYECNMMLKTEKLSPDE